MSEEIKDKVEELGDEIREEVNEAAEAVEAEVNEAAEAVEEAEAEVKEAAEAAEAEVEEAAENAEKTVEDKKEEFSQKVDEVKADVKEAYENVKDKAQDVFKEASAAFATAKEKAQTTVDGIKKEIDDYSDEMDEDDVNKNKLMAVLAYIGPLVLVPLIAARDSKFAKFHANQGLVLFLLAIACALLRDVKLIGWIFSVCGVVVFILAVVGIIYACQGKAKELPVVGNWKLIK